MRGGAGLFYVKKPSLKPVLQVDRGGIFCYTSIAILIKEVRYGEFVGDLDDRHGKYGCEWD